MAHSVVDGGRVIIDVAENVSPVLPLDKTPPVPLLSVQVAPGFAASVTGHFAQATKTTPMMAVSSKSVRNLN